jgi:uncharacterized SAM-binding protein YcdF (DUF218 family)
MWRKFLRTLKWLCLLLLLLGTWVAYVAWDIVQFGRKNEAVASDVAVVLGAAAWDRKPSPVLEERVNHAIHLYKKRLVKKILFTGGFGKGAAMAESEVARDYALQQGVKPQDIYVETKSVSTIENVTEAHKILAANQLKSVILVSDPLQMRRATKMMQDLGVTTHSSPTPTTRYRSKDSKWAFLISEVYKYNVYLLAGR